MEPWNRKLRMGMVGGGQGAFIGAVHRIAATLDQQAELVAIRQSSVRMAEEEVRNAGLRLKEQVAVELDLMRAKLRLAGEQRAEVLAGQSLADTMDRFLGLLEGFVGFLIGPVGPGQSQPVLATVPVERHKPFERLRRRAATSPRVSSGTNAGRTGTTVWPTAWAIRYPPPVDPVAGYDAPPVATITASPL